MSKIGILQLLYSLGKFVEKHCPLENNLFASLQE
jgi:hypothetical protein